MRSRCRCSMCPAIHITSRSWLRSSSTREPSDPPLRVVRVCEQNDGSPTLHALSVNRPYKVKRQKTARRGDGREAARSSNRRRRSARRQSDRSSPRPGRSNETRPTDRNGTGTPTRHNRVSVRRTRRRTRLARLRSQIGNDRNGAHTQSDCSPRPSDARAGGNPRSIADRDRLFGPTATARCPCTCVVRLRTVDCASETDDVDKLGNDPSAGSPTETLLRLLLPLDDQV